MAPAPLTERLARRDRAITAAGLAALILLAWGYLLNGAGLGMNAAEMTQFALFPHRPELGTMAGMDMAGAQPPPARWDLARAALIAIMWWIMMIAMMAPGAVPAILLYARVHRHALAQGSDQHRLAPSWAFAVGYLLVWLAFALVAAALHGLLEQTGILSAMTMGSRSRWLSGAVLIGAGLYQLSPLKHRCLAQCRAPADFLTRQWRPHLAGALRLGALHGAYCVGCCWLLMLLLFVGGVMNLVWIAALTLLVAIEKIFPAGGWIGRGAGLVLMLWGLATLLA
jgi:predicted metal-binding membrane protein